jgi:multicomponent K+:H+ antiporter subunit D
VLAAGRLAAVVANLVVISTGVLLAAIADGTVEATAAALYYLVHTTLATAAFFLLSGRISRQRGDAADAFVTGPPIAEARFAAALYLVLAIAVSGLPPLSGFVGKLMVMQSLQASAAGPWAWAAILASGLVAALVLARAASVFFWEPRADSHAPILRTGWQSVAILILILGIPFLTAAAAPVADYAQATAEQLHAGDAYGAAVLGSETQGEDWRAR